MADSKLETLAIAGAAALAAAAVGAMAGYAIADRQRWNREPKICNTILEHVGNTPLVRLQRVGKKPADGG